MQEITNNTPFWKWATVVILGSGSTNPRFGSPISSTTGCQMGGMDPNGNRVNSMYTMGNGMEKYGNNGEKCIMWLMENGRMCPKVLLEWEKRVLEESFTMYL